MENAVEFLVDLGTVALTKASIRVDYTRLAGVVDEIEKQIKYASTVWKSDFSSTVQKDAAKLISGVRQEQKTLADNLQKHLGMVMEVASAAESNVKSNADLFE